MFKHLITVASALALALGVAATADAWTPPGKSKGDKGCCGKSKGDSHPHGDRDRSRDLEDDLDDIDRMLDGPSGNVDLGGDLGIDLDDPNDDVSLVDLDRVGTGPMVDLGSDDAGIDLDDVGAPPSSTRQSLLDEQARVWDEFNAVDAMIRRANDSGGLLQLTDPNASGNSPGDYRVGSTDQAVADARQGVRDGRWDADSAAAWLSQQQTNHTNGLAVLNARRDHLRAELKRIGAALSNTQ